MIKSYSIAQARHDLAALVHELDDKPVIELTRRGKPVAMLVSMREYTRLHASTTKFWDAYQAYRKTADLAALEITPKIWQGVRDTSPGRELEL